MSMHFINLTDYQEECVKQYKEYIEKKRGIKYTKSEILDIVISIGVADLEMDLCHIGRYT